jgi:hypothetical protein
MTKKTLECKNCAVECTITYDYDEVGEDPTLCPFCGEQYIEEELKDMEYPLNDNMDDEW